MILVSRRREELERVKNDLQQKQPKNINSSVRFHEPKIAILDLSIEDTDQLEAIAQSIVQIHGHVDILVNNAGISSRAAAMNTAMAVDRQLILVNYLNQIALTKVVLRSLVEKREDNSHNGHIVCISSVQGRMAIPGRSSYSASKHAVQAYYDSLRAELWTSVKESGHRPVDVTVISPGYIRTSLSLNALSSDGRKHGRMDATTASGLEPAVVAERVLEAVLNREADLVIAPLLPKLLIIVRSVCPPLYFFAMNVYAKKQHWCSTVLYGQSIESCVCYS